MRLTLRHIFLGLVALVLVGGIAFAWTNRDGDDSAVTPTDPAASLGTISPNDLAARLIKGEPLLVLDVRSKSDYYASHIPNAISLPPYDLATSEQRLSQFTSWETILVCAADACSELSSVARDLQLLGFTSLKKLAGGMTAYQETNLSLASQAQLIQEDLRTVLTSIEVPEVAIDAIPDGAVLVDVRTPFEFVTGFIPGAINIPLYAFAEALDKGILQKDTTIVVYDKTGARAALAAEALIQKDFSDTFNLTGGLDAWVAADREASFPAEDGSDLEALMPLIPPGLVDESKALAPAE